MISTSDFKTGLKIEVDGEIYEIIDYQHVKLGRGGAFVRTKLKNLRTSANLEKVFKAGERFERIILEEREAQYLYNDGITFYFMDSTNFEQLNLSTDQISDAQKYLKEGQEVRLLFHGPQLMGIELPQVVELEVVQTEPGVRGDTASGGTKPATLETGAKIIVPLFINVGDTIKIDTRSDTYLGRV